MAAGQIQRRQRPIVIAIPFSYPARAHTERTWNSPFPAPAEVMMRSRGMFKEHIVRTKEFANP